MHIQYLLDRSFQKIINFNSNVLILQILLILELFPS
jgi:hypothetical protein